MADADASRRAALKLESSSSSSSEDAEPLRESSPHKLPKGLLDSAVLKAVAPFLQKGWIIAFQTADKVEQKAFLQLASLPRNSAVDRDWVSSVHRSNQRKYKVLMTIFLHVAGSSSLQCSACQTRGTLKQRNCRALPPEAQGMRELQAVIGPQCANCYFYPCSKPCQFPTGRPPTTLKQTPVPVPQIIPPGSTTSGAVQLQPRPPDALRRTATRLNKPISQTPVPVPPIPSVKPFSSQPPTLVDTSQSSEDSDVDRQPRRLSNRASHDSTDNGQLDSYRVSIGSPDDRSSSAIPPTSTSSASTAALPSDLTTSHPPNAELLTTSAPLSTHPSLASSILIAKAFALFGEICELPVQEQPGVYQKIAELSEIARRPLHDPGLDAPFPPSAPAVEDWEVAPGCLSTTTQRATADAAAAGSAPVGFSSSFLRREVVSFEHAPRVSRSQRVLNKHLPPLGVVKIDRGDEEWECTLAVLQGFVKVRMGDLVARMSQGAVLVVGPGSDCIATNVMHEESKVQVRWTREN